MMGFLDAVVYANNLHLASDRQITTPTPYHNFYRPDALHDAQSTLSKHSQTQ